MSTHAPTKPTPEAPIPEKLLFQLNWAATRYWHQTLLQNDRALQYLYERGWDKPRKLAQKYMLGLAPGKEEASEKLTARIQQKGFQGMETGRLQQGLIEAGLAKPSKHGSGIYDFFYGRLMVPIPTEGQPGNWISQDQVGRVAAFGGRILPWYEQPSEGPPKYINTAETPIFRKRQIFYGQPWAQAAIREHREAIILEGYFDLLRVREAGFERVLASCGTSLTAEHIQTLHKMSGGETLKEQKGRLTVILATDADAAGRRAAERGAQEALKGGMLARVASFPQGKDPDDLIADAGEQGAEKFRTILQQAKSPVVNYLDVQSDYQAGPPWAQSLRSLVATLYNLGQRGVLGPPEQQQRDARAIARRLKEEGNLNIEPESMRDLFRQAQKPTRGLQDLEVGR